jgi:hypothetical protein
LYSIAKESKVPYSTLNDLVNGKVRISECKAGMLHKLALTLGISMDELYSLAEGGSGDEHEQVMTSYGIPVNIRVRHKAYYIDFDYEGKQKVIELCKVSEASTFYVRDIAKWRAEEYIRDVRMHGRENGSDKTDTEKGGAK